MTIVDDVLGPGMNVVLLILVGVIIAAIIGGVIIFYRYRIRRYSQFRCVIWRFDGFGQLQQRYDDAGIFVDGATKNKRLFLKANNVGLNPDNIPYLPDSEGKKIIFMLQTGLKNFKYIKPNVSHDHVSFTVGEEDVNWALNAYEKGKKMFSSWLVTLLPFMIIAFSMVIMLVIVALVFRQIPEILTQMKEIAALLAQAKSGTTIVP